jgi:hypothetical protein
MFDWKLFLLLIAITVPGIFTTVARTISSFMSLMEEKTPAGRKIPSKPVLYVLSGLQSLILVSAFGAIGTAVAPSIGFHAPLFEALVSAGDPWQALSAQIFASLLLGVGGALVFVAVRHCAEPPGFRGVWVALLAIWPYGRHLCPYAVSPRLVSLRAVSFQEMGQRCIAAVASLLVVSQGKQIYYIIVE